MNFDPKTLPIQPIKDQYEFPPQVRDAVYAHYRMLSSFGLYIKEISIHSVMNSETGMKVLLNVESNSVMDPYNMRREQYSINA